jgi:[ribosomal protein S5]-alanine N-acetyltransferase
VSSGVASEPVTTTPLAPAVIRTPRLRGERISATHLSALCELLGDERVGATLGGTRSPDEVASGIAAQASHWDAHGFGYWMFFDGASGAPVARGGLSRAHVGGRHEVEVGWAVTPRRWGEGLATELGAAAVAVAFGPLALPDVVAYTLPDNLASRRVMEKLGFVYERDVMHAALAHVLYRLQPPGS